MLFFATLVALAAHAWMLGLWADSAPPPGAVPVSGQPGRAVAVTIEVRQVARAPVAEPVPAPTAPAADFVSAPPSAMPRPTSAAPRSRASTAEERNPQLTPAPGRTVPTAIAAAAASESDLAPAVDAEVSAAASLPPSAPPLPTYRTALPPPLDLHYEVRRGEATGAARISWRLDADGRYALEMSAAGTAAAGGALTPHWTSHGHLDADGVAPERFAVSRRGRERHAANFRRDAGIVSFAGPSRTWPLAAGAQDRLSWMVQLAAVLRAHPELAEEGAQISMMVVGAHGDAGVWTFSVGPLEAVTGPAGEPLPAWPLTRESGHAHDPQVQVWLAPALHHLPVRLKLTLPRSGESTEMRLRTLWAP